jgi:hypothetical protein
MPRYRLRSKVTVYYEHDVEAASLEEAIEAVEDGLDDGVETDNSSPEVTEYAIEGRMGWYDRKLEDTE